MKLESVGMGRTTPKHSRMHSEWTRMNPKFKIHYFTQEKAIKFDKANQYKYAADAYERVVSTIQKSLYIDERLNQKGKVVKIIVWIFLLYIFYNH